MARAPLFAARRSAQVTAHGTPVSGPGATAKWKRCGTEARVLLGGACAALASTFLGPSSPQHGARLPAWPRVWSPAPPPDMSPRDPDPGCFPGELPGGPGALGRMIVTGQTAETSPSLGRDEKATGWWDGRRSWQHRWLSGRCVWNKSAWTCRFPGGQALGKGKIAGLPSQSFPGSGGGAGQGALHTRGQSWGSRPAGRQAGRAVARPEVVRAGGEGALWLAAATSSPQRRPWPPMGGGRSGPASSLVGLNRGRTVPRQHFNKA